MNLPLSELLILNFLHIPPPPTRWYRGKVAELGENLEVVFLDHGDQESVPRTELRPMPRYLLEVSLL